MIIRTISGVAELDEDELPRASSRTITRARQSSKKLEGRRVKNSMQQKMKTMKHCVL